MIPGQPQQRYKAGQLHTHPWLLMCAGGQRMQRGPLLQPLPFLQPGPRLYLAALSPSSGQRKGAHMAFVRQAWGSLGWGPSRSGARI
jgi:hypothetical protein